MTHSPQDADCFSDWTHPSDLDVKESSWVTFAKELDEACLSIFPKNPPQYTGVHALLLNWADDDLGTDVELVDFQAQLKEQFNFTVEIWKIPSQRPELKLQAKIMDVLNVHGGENKLLIVYYGGHGKHDEHHRSIWTAYVALSRLI